MNTQENPPTAAAAATPQTPQATGRQRILLVEDDGALLLLNVMLLKRAGYEVETARDGAAGRDALQAGHFDLIITDNSMPRLSGLEMIWRMHSAGMKIPVIMATGIMREAEFKRHAWFKPDAMLLKPYTAEDLLRTVAEVLRATNAAHLPPEPPPLEPSQLSLHDAQMKEAEARTAQANTRTDAAEMQTMEANTRTQQAEALTVQADARTQQAEAQTARAETSEQRMRASEMSYRRLFEAAKDGIMILEVDTGWITDANKFIIDLPGFSLAEMAGKKVGELSPFKDIESNWGHAVATTTGRLCPLRRSAPGNQGRTQDGRGPGALFLRVRGQ